MEEEGGGFGPFLFYFPEKMQSLSDRKRMKVAEEEKRRGVFRFLKRKEGYICLFGLV